MDVFEDVRPVIELWLKLRLKPGATDPSNVSNAVRH